MVYDRPAKPLLSIKDFRPGELASGESRLELFLVQRLIARWYPDLTNSLTCLVFGSVGLLLRSIIVSDFFGVSIVMTRFFFLTEELRLGGEETLAAFFSSGL